MNEVVECVPNFSEGKNEETINTISGEIEKTPGVKLLDVDPDPDYNRTVVTFAGEPDSAVEAAFKSVKKASELIDMSEHKGEHPRMGAADVVPFIPVSGMTMDDCVDLANRLGKRIGDNLDIPVYLYEYAATKPERKNLADIRKGEYEALPEKLENPEWEPDCGPAKFNPAAGATVTGARKFLIAYNVNLADDNLDAAKEISYRIRESGRVLRDEDGNKITDENGNVKREPGSLKNVKAMGFMLDDYDIAQVSMNLTDYEVTPPHKAFEEIKREADSLEVEINGSEVVGLIPKEALLVAGDYYLDKESGDKGLNEREKVDVAVEKLGLNALHTFDPDEKIIEYMI